MLSRSAFEPKNTKKHSATGNKQGQIKGKSKAFPPHHGRRHIVTHPRLGSAGHPTGGLQRLPLSIHIHIAGRLRLGSHLEPDERISSYPNGDEVIILGYTTRVTIHRGGIVEANLDWPASDLPDFGVVCHRMWRRTTRPYF